MRDGDHVTNTQQPYVISDTNLPILVRKLAIHINVSWSHLRFTLISFNIVFSSTTQIDLWIYQSFFTSFEDYIFFQLLTHLFPMHSFSTPWKHQKTFRFSDVFKGVEKRCTGSKCVKHTQELAFQTCIPLNLSTPVPGGIYLLKINNRNTKKSCEICSKLTIKTPEHISHFVLVFLLLTLSR